MSSEPATSIAVPRALPDAEVYLLTLPAGASWTPDRIAAVREQWHEELGPRKRLVIVGGGATIEPLSHLDAAWREAEAALPDGWVMLELRNTGYRGEGERWLAMASPADDYMRFCSGYGDSPAAALRALAIDLARVAR